MAEEDDLFNSTSPPVVEWTWRSFSWTYFEALHLVSAVIGIIGNFLVIQVLNRRRAADSRSTDTLIGALAVADFLTSIFIIPLPSAATVPTTHLGKLYCKMTLPGFFLFVSFTSSIYILTTISVERFLAITYPLRFNQLMVKKRILGVVISLIWVTSIAVYIIFIATTIIVDPVNHRCTVSFISPAWKAVYGYFMFSFRLLFPCSVMLVTQVAIVCTLQRSSVRFRGQMAVSFHVKARNRVLKLMLIVILIYVLTWGPGQVSFLLYTIGVLPPSYVGSTLHTSIILLTTLNSCMNPVIYIVWFGEFRVALRQMFSCQKQDAASPFGDNVLESTSTTTAAQRSDSNI
ncbi:allatostatin-A receptor-like [Strongylocentrotus purpuratus]|uniref:G-protein coupled receptors family 1 profile domain-containing protein n=1 Tax=Strongylocentrotus purpuratus TaxID=7668 RepID=A0A7M7N5H1_STRPU|nr:allatostatin-A receptor-like [Strongylocentrotus purpuratus]